MQVNNALATFRRHVLFLIRAWREWAAERVARRDIIRRRLELRSAATIELNDSKQWPLQVPRSSRAPYLEPLM